MSQLREQMRIRLRAVGGVLWHSDRRYDWFTLPNPDEFYDIRDDLPFSALYCHEREGGLVVDYQAPKTNVLDHPRGAYIVFPLEGRSELYKRVLCRIAELVELGLLSDELCDKMLDIIEPTRRNEKPTPS